MLRLLANTLTGNNLANRLDGGAGNDTVFGANGADTIWGETGNDNLSGELGFDVIYGGEGRDTLVCGAGDDLLFGGDGNDRILGSNGADTINDGLGFDTLIGGDGADVFVYVSISDASIPRLSERIEDFTSGIDRIDLSAIDANMNTAGNGSFVLVGAFTNVAGQLLRASGAFGVEIHGDTNGDGVIDFTILLAGIDNVAPSDLIL